MKILMPFISIVMVLASCRSGGGASAVKDQLNYNDYLRTCQNDSPLKGDPLNVRIAATSAPSSPNAFLDGYPSPIPCTIAPPTGSIPETGIFVCTPTNSPTKIGDPARITVYYRFEGRSTAPASYEAATAELASTEQEFPKLITFNCGQI